MFYSSVGQPVRRGALGRHEKFWGRREHFCKIFKIVRVIELLVELKDNV